MAQQRVQDEWPDRTELARGAVPCPATRALLPRWLHREPETSDDRGSDRQLSGSCAPVKGGGNGTVGVF